MRILMTVAQPGVHGPIPKLTPLMQRGLEQLGCTVTAMPYGRRLATSTAEEPFPRKVLERTQDLWAIVDVARREHFDLLLMNTAHDWLCFMRDIPLLAIARLLRLPAVVFMHGSEAGKLADGRDIPFEVATAVMLRLCSGLIVLSKEEADIFQRKWPWLNCLVSRYPVEIPSEIPSGLPALLPSAWLEEQVPILLFVGRLVPAKGIRELIEAFPSVLARTSCRLAVLGEGVLRESLEQQAKALHIDQYVLFVGYVGDQQELQRWYNVAAALVLPSHAEGFSVAVLEAAAAGLPVICTRIRGMADWMEEGTHALFIPMKSPGILANRIVELLSNDGLRARMSAANRAWIRAFEPAVVMEEYLAFFRSIVDGRGK